MTDLSVDWESAYRYLEMQYEQSLAHIATVLQRYEDFAGSLDVAITGFVIEQVDDEVEIIVLADGPRLEYALYIFRGKEIISRCTYSRSNTFRFKVDEGHEYMVRGFIRREGSKQPLMSKYSKKFEVSRSRDG